MCLLNDIILLFADMTGIIPEDEEETYDDVDMPVANHNDEDIYEELPGPSPTFITAEFKQIACIS